MRVSVSLHTRTHEPGVDRFKTIAVHWFTESPFASIGLYFSWIKETPQLFKYDVTKFEPS